MNEDDELDEAIRAIEELKENLIALQEEVVKSVRRRLNGQSKETIKAVLSGVKTKVLEYWLKNSLEGEQYEICQAIKEVMEERNGI